jgi:NitT/TauT family transport system substrate-binding protein
MSVKRTVPVAAAVVLATLTIAVLVKRKGPSQTSTVAQVTFRLDWAPGAEHSFLYLAQQRGYFEKEKLAVAIQAGDGSTTSAKLVGNGTVNYALCSGDTALIAASADVPIRVLAVLYSRTPAVVYSRKDRNITKPKDLEGRRYGAFTKSTTYNQFLAFCAVAGVDLAKVQVIPTAGKADDILTDGVDASGAYTYIQPIQCELVGVPVNEIPMADYGVESYSVSIIANKNSLHPDVARRVVRAALLAFNEMVSNNSAALEAFFVANPAASKEFEKRKLERLTQFVRKNLETQRKAGAQTLQGWQQTQDFLLSQKLISKKIDLSDFFTSEFLPE